RLRSVWELEPGAGGTTRVSLTVETRPATLSDRLMESFGLRRWLGRRSGKALRRVRSILEEDEGRGTRATIARSGRVPSRARAPARVRGRAGAGKEHAAAAGVRGERERVDQRVAGAVQAKDHVVREPPARAEDPGADGAAGRGDGGFGRVARRAFVTGGPPRG